MMLRFLPALYLLFACHVTLADADTFRTEIVASNLEHPWGMAFLPDGRLLVTERPGRLRIIDQGEISEPLQGLPEIAAKGQGGLLDVAIHPRFAENQLIYLSYVAADDKGATGTEVGRARLRDGQLTDWQTLFRLAPKTLTTHHFGSRLVFDRDGFLFITLGDRGDRFRAQDTSDHAGSVIRLHDDGRIPADNPLGAIYSYGHRNLQGAALNPWSGQLWTHEHGPQGGDELNIIRKGANYGWPIITYGKEYGSGSSIGEGYQKAGMEQPLYYWVPSIAPSGMTFYTSDAFPQWKGNLFIGSLKFQLLVRLELHDDRVVHEERLLKGQFGRIRDVESGPDGFLYLLTDQSDGQLIRIRPD